MTSYYVFISCEFPEGRYDTCRQRTANSAFEAAQGALAGIEHEPGHIATSVTVVPEAVCITFGLKRKKVEYSVYSVIPNVAD